MIANLERPRHIPASQADCTGYSLPKKPGFITFIISIRHNSFNKRNLYPMQTESHHNMLVATEWPWSLLTTSL